MRVTFYPHPSIHPSIDGWMDGWMDGWVDGWMGGWMIYLASVHASESDAWSEDEREKAKWL